MPLRPIQGGETMSQIPLHRILAPVYSHLEKTAVPVGGVGSEYVLFASWTEGEKRARVQTFRGSTLAQAWTRATTRMRKMIGPFAGKVRWIRIDVVNDKRQLDWENLGKLLTQVKRNYCRQGISLDHNFRYAFLEQEINANAMLYSGPKFSHCVINQKNFARYARIRHGLAGVDFEPQTSVWTFTTNGYFLDMAKPEEIQVLGASGRSVGRREIDVLDAPILEHVIETSSEFLSGQLQETGRFIYGWHPCFDREINAYNTLRHASTTYSMIEAWEVTKSPKLWAAIERSLHWLRTEGIKTLKLPSGEEAAFIVDEGNEIKLGANAVCVLAFTKYASVTGRKDDYPLLEKLALGIRHMQRPHDGSFVHVLNYPDLSLKEAFRTIYYEGEAAFGLMRLYSLTSDPRWIKVVENGFEHFIAKDHWKHNDHWLSYCVNELTIYRPLEKYFEFGLKNVSGYLDFVLTRITTFPTLLELMMASRKMVDRIDSMDEMRHLLNDFDLIKFNKALHFRAKYLLNGYFWPEFAMFFAKPERIVGSFFIRHHAFRVRIDDVEHYLSGMIAYRAYFQATNDVKQVEDVVA